MTTKLGQTSEIAAALRKLSRNRRIRDRAKDYMYQFSMTRPKAAKQYPLDSDARMVQAYKMACERIAAVKSNSNL